ncbi:hypothetical protein [Brevundimonas sp. Root1423]|uniref:hypothetical protein n=1 Tax=Brevundimonas sp. Root1423 TaxID=1736462 RepID=UPI0006F67C1F|nr:hypothetical protein [Brevundimonas sp. Root1423]KQY80316.1 hypothetical protein ASD25_09140 [Brevundimonas sp. Root1423]
MKLRILSVAAVLTAVVTPAMAQQAEAQAAPAFEIMRTSDTAMTCPQISEEAAQLSQQLGGTPGGGILSAVTGVASAGAAMLIPGAGLAIAGVDALTRPDRDRKEAEAAAVRHRWYYLNGLYAGQDCQALSDAAGPTPASPADAAPAPDQKN